MARPLDEFAEPVFVLVDDGLTPADDQDIGELSPERRRALNERLRELDAARRRAMFDAQFYFIGGSRG